MPVLGVSDVERVDLLNRKFPHESEKLRGVERESRRRGRRYRSKLKMPDDDDLCREDGREARLGLGLWEIFPLQIGELSREVRRRSVDLSDELIRHVLDIESRSFCRFFGS